MSITKYREQIYAGVLGKMLGVYLGRPVEGWSYEKIRETFDEVKYYVHDKVGVPLIVADDDISGTFAFFRTLEDNGNRKDITAQDFGNTWLNYIIENRTILWWGGLGRSTEHTAYLNLKNGIPAPKSGSVEVNGQTMAEQIGAQIFIDAIAMACPGNPDMAVDLVRKSASVSHDGLALEAACHLAALEAMAFEEKNIDTLLDRAGQYLTHPLLKEIIADVRDICRKESDWRKVREYLEPKYGYDVFLGSCHMVPNHAMVIASIILGGDDFQKSISIATSAAWDTDCNAGNVGAFNGIRLGLEGINAGADFRTPVADLMYVVTSDGGSTVTDAVLESKRIIRTAAALAGETVELSEKRYTFEFPGSLQGFAPCEYGKDYNAVGCLENANNYRAENGLLISCNHMAAGVTARVATQTFVDYLKLGRNSTYAAVASPTLYSTQIVETSARLVDDGDVFLRPYILYYDLEDEVQILYGDYVKLSLEENVFQWEVPDTRGMHIFKLGYELSSEKRYDGKVIISSVDWDGAPQYYTQQGMLMTSIWNTNPLSLAGFASSAAQFAADSRRTYCVSHVEENGLVTIGSREWKNYSVASRVYYNLHQAGGLVIRSVGHRRYYGAVLENYNQAVLYMQKDGERTELARVQYAYAEDLAYDLKLTANGEQLVFEINGKAILEAQDSTYTCGGAGFVISKGTMTCDGIIVESSEQ